MFSILIPLPPPTGSTNMTTSRIVFLAYITSIDDLASLALRSVIRSS